MKHKHYFLKIFSASLFFLSLGATTSYAYDTSTIPSRPSSPISLVDNEIYDFGGRTINGSNIQNSGLFRCMNRRGVVIKNVTVTGSPRYALFARGCSSFVIENFKMINNSNSVGGIRFDQGTENRSVVINNIEADKQGGHALELWDVNGFSIGNVNAYDTSGSGVLVNRSRNGSIGKVTGYRNNQSGGYATLRFANNAGPNLTVGEVFSRDSGRGFFTVSGAHGIRVSKVDAHRSNREAIYIQDSSNVSVGRGIARSSGSANCRIRNSPNSGLGSLDCGGSIAN
ncbi:MAG: hypothetical protein KTR17_10610 [Cellvibrionaceae bacterium]|nr:hypothetical protein [Cellvibrionaceae bacterium]